MFTLDQIKLAHSQVKSGADFPKYLQDLKELGVSVYETFVKNGNTNYSGINDYKISSGAKYDELSIAEISNSEDFKNDLKAHQQGKTDYSTFCKDSAKSGVEKWIVDTKKMTCSYYDLAGNEMLVEIIPQ